MPEEVKINIETEKQNLFFHYKNGSFDGNLEMLAELFIENPNLISLFELVINVAQEEITQKQLRTTKF